MKLGLRGEACVRRGGAGLSLPDTVRWSVFLKVIVLVLPMQPLVSSHQ